MMRCITRRDFMKGMMVGGIAAGSAGLLAACSSSSSSESASTEETTTGSSSESASADTSESSTDSGYDGEVTSITLYPRDAMLQSGVLGGCSADVLEKYGLSVEVWAYSDEKTNAILSSGSLPDVMYVTKDNMEIMIESGMILNLEDYLDQLTNVTKEETLMTAVNYLREFKSAGTGELYGIPIMVGGKDLEYGITKNMIVINWEYYTGIGAPEFSDQWELIDVMKQMMEAYPTGEDGVANWGTYLNTGNDTEYWGNATMYLKWFGYEPTELAYLLEADMFNGEYFSILEEDSKYREALSWYNAAYRAGVLDPDSISSDRSTQKSKVDNGHSMVPSGTIQGYASGGYQPVYMDGQTLYQESWNSIYGTNYVLVVNAASTNIEAALRFINMMADPDAIDELIDGPEGDLWYVEDGVSMMSDGVFDAYMAGETLYLSSGEELSTPFSTSDYVIDTGYFATSYLGTDGEYRNPGFAKWSEVLDAGLNSDMQNEWREMTGYEYLVDQAMANNAYKLESDLDYLTNFASTPDDMTQLTIDAIKDVVVTASWKMVYAETDEEFNEIWDQMVEDCNGLGAEDIIAWRLEDLEQAKEIRDSLSA